MRLSGLRCLLVVGLGLLGAGVSKAQVGVYGAFSTAQLTAANTPRIYGGMFGVYYDAKHYPGISLGLDGRFTALPSNSSTSTKSVLVGPRAVVHIPVVPLRVFGEVLIGGAHTTTGQGVAHYDGGGMETAWNIGVDATIFPHLDWRVLEFDDGHIIGVASGIKTVSSGVVVRF